MKELQQTDDTAAVTKDHGDSETSVDDAPAQPADDSLSDHDDGSEYDDSEEMDEDSINGWESE